LNAAKANNNTIYKVVIVPNQITYCLEYFIRYEKEVSFARF